MNDRANFIKFIDERLDLAKEDLLSYEVLARGAGVDKSDFKNDLLYQSLKNKVNTLTNTKKLFFEYIKEYNIDELR